MGAALKGRCRLVADHRALKVHVVIGGKLLMEVNVRAEIQFYFFITGILINLH